MAGQVTTLFSDSAKTNELYPRTKTSAVSDANNHTLGDLAVYNAQTVASGVGALYLGLDMDLLWENENPTSNFSAQTISLNLSNYNLIYVIYYRGTDVTYTVSQLIKKNISVSDMVGSFNAGKIRLRSAKANDGGVMFESGTNYSSYGSGSTDNSVVIPYRIYGIRGQVNDLTGD